MRAETPLPGAIDSLTFRLSTTYELIPFDRLSAKEQTTVAELARERDFFGVVRPRAGAAGTIKAISRNTALLLYALQQPGPIPSHAVAGGDASVRETVWRLTLDGVVEVERNGHFVSGAAADTAPATTISRATSAVARVSHDAIHLVARIDGDSPIALGERLYAYNRRPVTPTWSARAATPGAVLRFAGVDPSGPVAGLLEKHWKRKAALDNEYWVSWWPRSAGRHHRLRADNDVTYKLYISPATETLPTAFPTIVETLAEAGAPPFKIGGSVHAILRPDKIVAYFATRRAAEETARMLGDALAGTQSHAVPFTRELIADGLVSLGIDPPVARGMLSQTGSSWRMWVCRRLASYVHTARATGEPARAAQFALERIARDGIDPSTWEPSASAVSGYLAERVS